MEATLTKFCRSGKTRNSHGIKWWPVLMVVRWSRSTT